jgi:hypothetical protein
MIEEEEYLKAKSIVDAYEKQNIDKDILEEFEYFKKGSAEVERIINLPADADLKKELINSSVNISKKYVRNYYSHMSALFLNISLNRVNELGEDAEKRGFICRKIIFEIINGIQSKTPKPIMPLSRVIRDGCSNFCSNCGSTESKNGFLGIFGKLVCHNNECKNSK